MSAEPAVPSATGGATSPRRDADTSAPDATGGAGKAAKTSKAAPAAKAAKTSKATKAAPAAKRTKRAATAPAAQGTPAAASGGPDPAAAASGGPDPAAAASGGPDPAAAASGGPVPDLGTLADKLVVRPDEQPWSVQELEEVLAQLQADLARLAEGIAEAESDIADLLRDTGDGAGEDQADAGAKTFEREHEMSLAANARDMYEQTARALQRIQAGSYGVCESCGQPIGKRRLQAFPRATLCLSCKQRQERR